VEFSDGSIGQDLPMDQLSQLFNVNHFVVSQVNPHIVPFVLDSQVPQIVRLSVQLFADEIVSVTRWLCLMGKEYGVGNFSYIFSAIYSLATQRYLGDITIHPSPHLSEYFHLLSNPNEDLKQSCIQKARKRTWGQLARLKVHCGIEFCLDDCLRRMRGTVIIVSQQESDSQTENVTTSVKLSEALIGNNQAEAVGKQPDGLLEATNFIQGDRVES